jgi:hypothetical protein
MGEHDASRYDDEMIDATLPSEMLTNFSENERRVFVKTHMRESDERRALYILRDGRDALVSLARYTVDIVGTDKSYEETLRMLITGEYQPPACTWSEHVRFYANRHDTLIVRYEDMLKKLSQQLQRVSFYFAIPFHAVNVAFDELHEASPKFYRRGIVGAWKDEMPIELQQLFWQYHGVAMKEIGYA